MNLLAALLALVGVQSDSQVRNQAMVDTFVSECVDKPLSAPAVGEEIRFQDMRSAMRNELHYNSFLAALTINRVMPGKDVYVTKFVTAKPVEYNYVAGCQIMFPAASLQPLKPMLMAALAKQSYADMSFTNRVVGDDYILFDNLVQMIGYQAALTVQRNFMLMSGPDRQHHVTARLVAGKFIILTYATLSDAGEKMAQRDWDAYLKISARAK